MGNRAIIIPEGNHETGVYLHWNGGEESVIAFLMLAKELGVRDPVSDPAYFTARFAQIVANFFGGTLSVGIGHPNRMDDSDNGRYWIGENFEIVRRQRGTPRRYEQLRGKSREYCDGVYAEAKRKNAEAFKDPLDKVAL